MRRPSGCTRPPRGRAHQLADAQPRRELAAGLCERARGRRHEPHRVGAAQAPPDVALEAVRVEPAHHRQARSRSAERSVETTIALVWLARSSSTTPATGAGGTRVSGGPQMASVWPWNSSK